MKFDLEPVDWLLNPRRPHEPWAKPAARKFKAEKSAKLAPTADTGFDEALVMWNAKNRKNPATPLAPFSTENAWMGGFDSPTVLTLIAKLYPIECVAEWIQAVPKYVEGEYGDSFRRCILPYLSVAEREVLREAVTRQASDNAKPNGLALLLAGLLGAPPKVEEYLATFTQWIQLPERAALFGLPESQVRQRHAELTNCSHADQLLALIANMGLDYLEEIIGHWMAAKTLADRPLALLLTSVVQDPAAAPLLLPLLDRPKLAPPVRAWFERYGAAAADALATHPWRTVGAKDRKQREAAMILADSLRQRSKPSTGVTVGFDFGTTAAGKAPSWISPSELPPIEMRGTSASLDAQASRDLLALLAATPPLEVPAPIAALKSQATEESLDRWALELMEAWRQGGMKPKDRWALAATGVLGGPLCVSRIVANIGSWAGGSRYETARLGYQCLIRTGSREALWAVCEQALNGLSFASDAATEEAKSRGMTVNELAETVMPTFGFDARGEREFVLGSRRLKLEAAEELRIFEEDGKILESLPKIRKGEDAAVYNQAVADFRTLKRAYEQTAQRELKRLERCSHNRRRFAREHFEKYILPHPLLGALARGLVWGAFYPDQNRFASFRVDEAGGFAGIQDDAIELPPEIAFVRILNIHDFEPEEREAWAAILADYNIVQPFPQLAPEERPDKASDPFRNPGNWHPGVSMHADAYAQAPQSDLDKMTQWNSRTAALTRCSAGYVRDPFRRDSFEKQLDRCLYTKDAEDVARRKIGDAIVRLHYLHMGRWGLAWLLQVEDLQGQPIYLRNIDPAVLDILAEDFKELGLRES